MRNLLLLLRHLRINTIEKGEIIIEKGELRKDVYFVRKGLIRSFFINEKSEEITFHLLPENHVFGNIHAILFDEPSLFSYQALERTKVYTIEYDAYFKVVEKNPEILEINRMHFNKTVLRQAFQRVESLVLLSPEDRYKKYVKDYPNVIGRTPDKYIANVLGITPTSLSRIRKRISSKKE
ncbi:MAG: Crp/Fnr family transcriptional regulator [Bacteroidota bacterium]